MDSLVSVIIPVYNVRPYLAEALDSVIHQTYENLEILITDDGSTDGSGELCDEYAEADKRINVFHTGNRGLAAARNYGLDHIQEKAEYIVFLDGDDWMEPVAIQLLIEAASRHHADLICCRHFHEYYTKTKLSRAPDLLQVLEGDQIIRSFLCFEGIGDEVWNKLYRKKLFNAVRYPEGRYYEDIATTYRVVTNVGKAVVIPNRLIHYRARRSSISSSHTMSNLRDYWLAQHEKCEGLSAALNSNEEYRNYLLTSELNAIFRMWRWYCGCSETEKKEAEPILDKMQLFLSEHYNEIIQGNRFTLDQKCAYLCIQSRNPFLMKMLYGLTMVYRALKYEREFE